MKRRTCILFALAFLVGTASAQTAAPLPLTFHRGSVINVTFDMDDADGDPIDMRVPTAWDSVSVVIKRGSTAESSTLATYNCADDSELTCSNGSVRLLEAVNTIGCPGTCRYELRARESGFPASTTLLASTFTVRAFGDGVATAGSQTVTVRTGDATITITAVTTASSLATSWAAGLTEQGSCDSGDYLIYYDPVAVAYKIIDCDNLPSGGGGTGDNAFANGNALTNFNLTDSTEIGYAINRTASPDEVSPYVIGIATSKVTSGTFADARIAESNVTQHEAAINHDNLTGFVANEHIDWTQASQGTIHATNYTDNNTQLSQEQVEDFAGGMVTGGTETLITVTYDDANGRFNFVVNNDLSQYDNTTSNFSTGAHTVNTDDQTIDVLSFDGTNISISLEDDGQATQTLDISSVSTDDQTAAEVTSTPTGNIEATNVDAAIAELEAEKQPLSSNLTDFAGKSAPSGDVVGTSDTQTLTGKTIDADDNTLQDFPFAVKYFLSDQTTDLTTGAAKVTDAFPYPCALDSVTVYIKTPTAGAALQVDVNEGGTSIFSTPLTVDAGDKHTYQATTPAVISDASIAVLAEITVDIDAVGSSTAGQGATLTFYCKRSF